MLNQKPWFRLLAFVAARSDQNPGTPQLPAMESEFEFPFSQRSAHILGVRRPITLVPDHYRAASILTLRNYTFKVSVLSRMIFHLHRKPFHRRIERRPLGKRPR